MPRKMISLRPDAQDALAVLGQQVKAARLRRGWTVVDTAARVGVATATYLSIEQGRAGTAIGNVFNAASILGVPLFSTTDPAELTRLRRSGERDLGLLKTKRATATDTKVKVNGFPD